MTSSATSSRDGPASNAKSTLPWGRFRHQFGIHLIVGNALARTSCSASVSILAHIGADGYASAHCGGGISRFGQLQVGNARL